MIRSADKDDAAAFCGIYNYYIQNTSVTFEEQPVSVSEMEQRIADHLKDYPWLVFEDDTGRVTGYCYASKWRTRPAYGHSVELSVYVDRNEHKKGIASALYGALFPLLQNCSVHAAVAGIALPNEPSRLLHEKFGFTNVARFKDIGRKFGTWTDVGYWEYIF